MTHRLVVRREAGIDVQEAALWYDLKREGLGVQFLDEVAYVLRRISDQPAQFPWIEAGVRRALVRRFPYGVYFIQEGEVTTVLTVLHPHRQPGFQ